jgi:hypothetical protein
VKASAVRDHDVHFHQVDPIDDERTYWLATMRFADEVVPGVRSADDAREAVGRAHGDLARDGKPGSDVASPDDARG